MFSDSLADEFWLAESKFRGDLSSISGPKAPLDVDHILRILDRSCKSFSKGAYRSAARSVGDLMNELDTLKCVAYWTRHVPSLTKRASIMYDVSVNMSELTDSTKGDF